MGFHLVYSVVFFFFVPLVLSWQNWFDVVGMMFVLLTGNLIVRTSISHRVLFL
ncbi:hypothetical protein RchiOBHm_Chr2g0095211 [Rosa chinensis]|uniref:Uncharacterized protein n=1 Tax=Rosa chinensis TaxID=74649 RepID=A0A2P6RKR0_ROSCH|nr:hypothetical protein RchiOBHm_Chr2g0095211 [Rosa chinensis]